MQEEGATVGEPHSEVTEFDGEASRHPVEIGVLETPGISANVEVWGIETGGRSLFFLPEGALLYEDGLYRAVSYEALGITYRPSRVAEDPAEVPGDAEVVGETWRYAGANGGPDPRRVHNPRYTVALYGLLSISGTGLEGMRLLVSNKAAAVRFSRAFGAGRNGQQHGAHDAGGESQFAREERARRHAKAEVERLGALLKVLGMAPGVSQKEIDGAYKKKAKMYHPDRVANMDPEVREMAELRMKEINAAYAELKRKNR